MKKWTVDPQHSEVQFKIRHLVISNVSGTFNIFSGELTSSAEDFHNSDCKFELDVNSIDTNVSDRDQHLKGDDFFSADKYPKIKFEGQLQKFADNYKLIGPMTIKDVTKNVELEVEYGGSMVDGYGKTKAGFEITGKINRKEFGLTWNQLTETGGLALGEEVKLNLNIQLAQA